LVASGSHTCTVSTAGGVKCWGDNFSGQLGNGTTKDSTSPVAVSGLASGVATIAAGNSHTCAVLTTGTAKCWGYNGAGGPSAGGGLGNGTSKNASKPVTVSGLTGASTITAGYEHTCAALTNGTVKCWGTNSSGQLGNGSTASRATKPVVVSGLTGVVAVSAGFDHNCALLGDGSVKCWGSNSYGQLGNKSTASYSRKPVTVFGLSGAVAVTAGGDHSCALLGSGAVKCWGDNFFGQLGNNTLVDKNAPVTVSGLSGVASVVAGYGHTCARLSAGGMKCWGDNASGELGNGTYTISKVAVTVKSVSGVKAIAAGDGHTCALLATGSVKCWGYNQYGAVGTGKSAGSTVPVAVEGLPGGAGGAASNLSVGGYDACAVTTAHTVRCWGSNDFGELGNGSFTYSPVPKTVPGITNATQVSAGLGDFQYRAEHTCALLTTHQIKCWGDNAFGSLGNGSTSTSTTPVLVSGIADATAVSAGWVHTCAIVTGGAVKCWGDNSVGQLGDGTTTQANTPVLVSGITGATAISAGFDHTCAITNHDKVTCWGRNDVGQLGDGTNVDSSTPVILASSATDPIANAISLNAGNRYTCVVISGGAAACWGANSSGQLGNGSTNDATVPTWVAGDDNYSSISAGLDHTCAVSATTATVCWGLGAKGELGNGKVTTFTSPINTKVTGLSNVAAVDAGINQSCAMLTTGKVLCWGDNANGELGNGAVAVRTASAVAHLGVVRLPTAAVTVPWAPAAPKGVAGIHKVTLTWSAASNGGKPITDYVVQYSTNKGTSWKTFADGVHSTTGAVVTGLATGKAYVFRVLAKSAAGTGAPGAKSTAIKPK
jgi:alpha-tubulin suppressor-like RCC1 family protein